MEWALLEACDAAAGLGALLRCAPSHALLGGADLRMLLSQSGEYIALLLSHVSAISRRAHADPVSGRAELESFTESRLHSITDAVQACLEVWVEAVSALATAEHSAIAQPFASDKASRLSDAKDWMRGNASALYRQLVSARLELATASMLAGLDDDDPFEDERCAISRSVD